jgi:hypothetical protein
MAVKGPRRIQRREEHWRPIVTGQPASGLLTSAWCQQQGVTEASFYAWRRTLAGRGVNREASMREPPAQLVARRRWLARRILQSAPRRCSW